jgi:Tol biopolymer transport system component
MSAILNDDPPSISQIPVSLPPGLQRVVHRCLEKSPELRFQSAADLAFALEALSDAGSTSDQAIMPAATQTHWKWIALGALAVLGIVGVVTWFLMPTPEPRVTGTNQLTNGSNPFFVTVTDGSRLYFTDNRSTGPVLAQLSVTGGDVSVIPTAIKRPVLSDIRPDHSQLLVGTNDPGDTPVWSQPLPSGSPRQIGDLEASWAAWSPDSKQLIFTTGHDLYFANADGSARRKLASVADGLPDLAYFSPDGTNIRFSVHTGPTSGRLWEVRADGSNLHLLLPSWHKSAAECCGRWTPDGRYYIFTSKLDDGAIDIFALQELPAFFRKSSTKPTRLTFGPLKFSMPVVSLDGKRIFVTGSQQRGELVRYDNLSKQFVPFLGGISAEHVSFSRDGKWVTYVSIPDGSLWRSRVDGTEKLQLTFGPGGSALPRWSPDAKSIAFMSSPDGKSRKIYLIAADGGSPTLLPEIASGG